MKTVFQWLKKKKLTPVIILVIALLIIIAFVYLTEGTVVLPAIYQLLP